MNVFDLYATLRMDTKEYEKALGNATKETSKAGSEIEKILGDSTRSASSKASAIAAIYKKQGLDSSEAMKKAWSQIERGASDSATSSAKAWESAGGRITSVAQKIAKIAAGLFAAAKVVQFGKSVVSVGAQFESTMASVAAISGATGEALDRLKQKAREAGESSVFSASESAEAMTYMGMAGWKAEEMISGLDGILNLAAASGNDLATTSDIVTDALTAFGMSASESSNLADIMAAASTNANTNVAMMGETFKYAAATFGTLGAKAEDAAIGIGLMANAGIKGSMAGTALRTGLTNLANPTDSMAAAMGRYGVQLQKNADGSINFLATMQNIRSALGGLDAATKASAISMIFGKEAMSGWAAVVNSTEEDFNNLTAAVYGASYAYDGLGAAAGMAEAMNDTLSGALKSFQSRLEAVKITLYNVFAVYLKRIVQFAAGLLAGLNTALTLIIGRFGGLAQTVSSIGVGIKEATGAAADNLLSMGGSAKDMANSLTSAGGAIDNVSTGLEKASGHTEKASKGAGKVAKHLKKTQKAAEATRKALAGFDKIITLFADKTDKEKQKKEPQKASSAKTPKTPSAGGAGEATAIDTAPAVEDLDSLADSMGNAKAAGEELTGWAKTFNDWLNRLDTSRLSDSFGRLKTSAETLVGYLKGGLQWALENILAPIAKWAIESAAPASLDVLTGAINVLNAAIEVLSPAGQFLLDHFFAPLAKFAGDTIITILEGIAGALEWVANAISAHPTVFTVFAAFVGTILGLNAAAGAVSMIGSLAAAIGGGLVAAISGVLASISVVPVVIALAVAAGVALYKNWDKIKEVAQAVAEKAKKAWSDFTSDLKESFEILKTSWNETKEKFVEFGKNLAKKASEIGQNIAKAWTDLKSKVGEIWSGIKTAVSEKVNAIKTAVSEKITSLKNDVVSKFESVKSKASEVWNSIKTAVTEKVDAIKNAASEKFGALKSDVVSKFSDTKNKASEIWGDIKSSIAEKADSIKTAVSDKFNNLKTDATSKLNDLKTKASEIWSSIKTSITDKAGAIKSSVSEKFNSLKTDAVAKFNDLKSKTSETWNGIKTVMTEKVESAKSALSSKLSSIKSNFSSGFSSIKSTVTDKLSGVVSACKDKMSNALTAIKNGVANLKNALKFTWNLPKLELPKISVDGKFSLNPPSVPKFSIAWNAKGGIFDGAQIMGMMGNTFQGVGEAGKEALLPLERNTGWMDTIADKVASRVGGGGSSQPITINVTMELDGQVVGRKTVNYLHQQAKMGRFPLAGIV